MSRDKVIGLMALDGAALAKIVDDTVAMLRVTNPTWLRFYGDNLAAHVQQIILEGAAEARRQTKNGETEGFYGTGGIMITYDPIGEATTITVQVAYVVDDDDA